MLYLPTTLDTSRACCLKVPGSLRNADCVHTQASNLAQYRPELRLLHRSQARQGQCIQSLGNLVVLLGRFTVGLTSSAARCSARKRNPLAKVHPTLTLVHGSLDRILGPCPRQPSVQPPRQHELEKNPKTSALSRPHNP